MSLVIHPTIVALNWNLFYIGRAIGPPQLPGSAHHQAPEAPASPVSCTALPAKAALVLVSLGLLPSGYTSQETRDAQSLCPHLQLRGNESYSQGRRM